MSASRPRRFGSSVAAVVIQRYQGSAAQQQLMPGARGHGIGSASSASGASQGADPRRPASPANARGLWTQGFHRFGSDGSRGRQGGDLDAGRARLRSRRRALDPGIADRAPAGDQPKSKTHPRSLTSACQAGSPVSLLTRQKSRRETTGISAVSRSPDDASGSPPGRGAALRWSMRCGPSSAPAAVRCLGGVAACPEDRAGVQRGDRGSRDAQSRHRPARRRAGRALAFRAPADRGAKGRVGTGDCSRRRSGSSLTPPTRLAQASRAKIPPIPPRGSTAPSASPGTGGTSKRSRASTA